jgi:hypothetical protein
VVSAIRASAGTARNLIGRASQCPTPYTPIEMCGCDCVLIRLIKVFRYSAKKIVQVEGGQSMEAGSRPKNLTAPRMLDGLVASAMADALDGLALTGSDQPLLR